MAWRFHSLVTSVSRSFCFPECLGTIACTITLRRTNCIRDPPKIPRGSDWSRLFYEIIGDDAAADHVAPKTSVSCSDVANPLSRSQNWGAYSDGCVGYMWLIGYDICCPPVVLAQLYVLALSGVIGARCSLRRLKN